MRARPPALRLTKGSAPKGGRLLLTAILICGLSSVVVGEQRIALDNRRLIIGFEVQSLGFWRIAGRFNEAWGELMLHPKEPTRSWLKVVARTSSVSTASPSRDEQLRSPSFFDVERHPFLTFESTRITLTNRRAGIVTGNLNMLGVTRSISLTFELRDPRPAGTTHRSVLAGRFRASGSVQRSEWGMTALIPAISDEVVLQIQADLSN